MDYLVTSYLFKSGNHTAGQLTDLRSSLVNNNLFASLAVRNGYHHYFQVNYFYFAFLLLFQILYLLSAFLCSLTDNKRYLTHKQNYSKQIILIKSFQKHFFITHVKNCIILSQKSQQSVSVELQRIIDEFVSYQQSMADEQGMDAELIRSYTTGRTSTLMESSSKPKTISSYNAHVTEMREDDLDFEENDDGEDIEVFEIL